MADEKPQNSTMNVGRDVSGNLISGNGNVVNVYQQPSTPRADTFTPATLPPREELPEPGTLPPGSRIYFGRNDNFTGRVDDLKALAQALVYDPKPGALTVTQTIAGLGGIGKSQLAVEFCYRYGRYFQGVH